MVLDGATEEQVLALDVATTTMKVALVVLLARMKGITGALMIKVEVLMGFFVLDHQTMKGAGQGLTTGLVITGALIVATLVARGITIFVGRIMATILVK
jgi:hypothetical protein